MAMNVTDFLDVTPCTLLDGGYSVSEEPPIFQGRSYTLLRLVDGVNEDLMWLGHLEPYISPMWELI
jgi:hypothetical protein